MVGDDKKGGQKRPEAAAGNCLACMMVMVMGYLQVCAVGREEKKESESESDKATKAAEGGGRAWWVRVCSWWLLRPSPCPC
jgi:hypothetical protein